MEPSRRGIATWSGLLLLAALSGCATAQPFRLTHATRAPAQATPFRAGCATVAFTPEGNYPLAGYGGGARREEWPLFLGLGWPGQLSLWAHQAWNQTGPNGQHDMLVGNEGTNEDLTARALVLRPAVGPPLALVRIDAIATTEELVDLTLKQVRDLGYRPDTVFICATHTHSGVGAYMRAPMARLAGTDNYRPEIEARIAHACAQAIREAHAAARPAELGFARAWDLGKNGEPVIASNRRSGRLPPGTVAYDAIDTEIRLLLVRDLKTHAPIALMANYGVHCTVFGPKNLCFSRDLAGGIERALSKRLHGAPVLFVNGAEGDVRPRRIKTDGGFKQIHELGEAFADEVMPALEHVRTYSKIRLSTAVGEKELGYPRTLVALDRAAFLDGEGGVAGWLTEPLTLPVNLILWTLGLYNVHVHVTWNGGVGVVVQMGGYADRTHFRVGGFRIQAGAEDVSFLGIPGEATHDVGLELKAISAGRGTSRCYVLGLTQDHVGYIASETAYRQGGYEAWSTMFGEHEAQEILEAERGVLDALGLPGGGPRAALASRSDR